jgi:hypothetical protein
MSRFAATLLTIIVVGATAAPAIARISTFKALHTNVSTRFDTLLIGDEPGHLVAFFTAKGVGTHIVGGEKSPYKIDVWGSGDYRADGTGQEQGYARFTFNDGSLFYERWSSEVADSRDIGTAKYYGGTGRFEGMTGHSKFDCQLLGDRFICSVDGVLESP